MYLFHEDADKLVAEFKSKFNKLNTYGSISGLHRKWRTAYNAYYSNYFVDNIGVGLSGEQSELATLHVNHLRNIIRHIMNLTTQNRLVFDALAVNSDIQSRNAAVVANAVLDYFFYEKRFETFTKMALEMTLIFGTAFLEVRWDPQTEVYGMDENEQPVYKGEPKFIAYTPYDVVMDPTKDDYSKQNWVVTREIVNKWDLVALYPDLADDIINLPKIDVLQYFLPYWDRDEDSVWLYRAYHKPTPSLPKGRMTIFCDADLVLDDKFDNPYKALPVFFIRPEVKYGGAYGHATIFDLLPAQEAHNLLHSSIISNQKAFAVQNIAIFEESAINPMEIPGGLNILQVKHLEGAPNGGLPQALQLCATPQEVFKYAADLVSQMELVSGINSAARGAPPSNLTSGTAIALVSTAANTFNNSVESAYIQLCEESAGFLISILKAFMKHEEFIAIAGKSNTYAVESFTGEHLNPIKRVRIHPGNPLSKTLSGKVMIADNLLQNQSIHSPAEYLEVLQTGSITPILEGATAQEIYIKEENDRMAKGQNVQMLMTDNHPLHIQEHLSLTYRPDVRDNAAVLSVVLKHVQEHIDSFETMSQQNPQLLAIALGQPIQVAPPGPSSSGPSPSAGPAGGAPPPNPVAQAPGAPGETAHAPSQTAAAAEAGGPQAVAGSAMNRAANLAKKV